MATDVDTAYEAGETIAGNIGRTASPRWSEPNGIGDWFFHKAAFADVFEIERVGKRQYRLTARADDPWASPLQALANALHDGQHDRHLANELPERHTRAKRTDELIGIARNAFGDHAMDALADIVRDEESADAAEFRLAFARGENEHARHWFAGEWSLRAKERYRSQIIAGQFNKCACCGSGDRALQLNHRRKVRDWGATRPENLEALCVPCHRSSDRLGIRCH